MDGTSYASPVPFAAAPAGDLQSIDSKDISCSRPRGLTAIPAVALLTLPGLAVSWQRWQCHAIVRASPEWCRA